MVRPQAADRHNAVVDLADRAQILAGHLIRLGAPLAVPTIIDDEDSLLMGRRAGLGQEQLQSSGVYSPAIPGGLESSGVIAPGDAVLPRLAGRQPGQ
jgi:hypothetical protein